MEAGGAGCSALCTRGNAHLRYSSSAPSRPFDPKAVTRASWEPKPQRPAKSEGPLISFNLHPDAHVVPEPRKVYKVPGPRTKTWIKGLRIVQLCFRIVEAIAAAGILFLFIIIDDVSSLTSWILRITAGVVIIHCAYGVFHLAHPVRDRSPASSAAYQTFASVTDLAVLPLYAYGCLSVRNSSDHWGTLLQNESLMNYFIPSLFYALFVGVVIHLISMIMGLWLALKFRQITRLPPDMNPLEDNLTSRHKKKSSTATASTYDFEAIPFEQLRRSGMPITDDSLERPRSVPFHETRSTPRSSFGSADLPPRKYQIEPSNSPRNSINGADLQRMSIPAPPSSSHSSIAPAVPLRSPWRISGASYAELPTNEYAEVRPPYSRDSMHHQRPGSPRSHQQSRPSTASTTRGPLPPAHAQSAPLNPSQPRPAKFTEAWSATESLFNRTHAKNRAAPSPMAAGAPATGAYEAIRRRYDLSDSEDDEDSGSDYGTETATALSVAGYSVLSPPTTELDFVDLGASPSPGHPNPLRSNPSLASVSAAGTKKGPGSSVNSNSSSAPRGGGAKRPKSSFVTKSTPLSEIDLNDDDDEGRASMHVDASGGGGGADITDEKPAAPSYGGLGLPRNKRHTWAVPRERNSSIQPEADFYSKPYGDLRSATPPVIVGADRQVSSGNDYDFSGGGGGQGAKRYFSFRRNVSGKVLEEGRAVGYAH